jgi:hypothetical protein
MDENDPPSPQVLIKEVPPATLAWDSSLKFNGALHWKQRAPFVN